MIGRTPYLSSVKALQSRLLAVTVLSIVWFQEVVVCEFQVRRKIKVG
jgi:hypothetical protein